MRGSNRTPARTSPGVEARTLGSTPAVSTGGRRGRGTAADPGAAAGKGEVPCTPPAWLCRSPPSSPRPCRRRSPPRAGRARGDGGRGDVGCGRGRHLCAGRDHPGDGAVQRGGGCDRRAAARHRHGPGVVGREAGGVCERLGHGGAGVRARGGGAELLDAGHRGAREHAGAERRHDPLGVVGGGRGAGAYGSPPRRGAQGGLAAVAARHHAPRRHAAAGAQRGNGRPR